ncbi:YicC family protein, DUF1732 [Desulfonema limicola]|uniref:YicC family protein, DUF1732 n=1 Tax=Desulfonema limicola TaxID=45656 RepID=A0A975GH30_9BACT|nr:YicC/YloC family endoribonuclease [Desulfonema limicola]QTA80970.1 YicC family protein, DUF1732 [Desulfonema limicola]
MIKSMTAFSRAEKTQSNLTAIIEIRSYNSRYLDVTLRIAQSYLSLENKIKGLISEKISRGRVEVKIQIQDSSEETCKFEVDEIKAKAYYKALTDLKNMFDINTQIPLEIISNVSGIIKSAEIEKNADSAWLLISGCMNEALEALDSMRKIEGDYLEKDFENRLNEIETAIYDIEKGSDGLLSHYQEKLTARITSLTNGIIEIDPDRTAQEAAFLADKSDISEEIVRARSHVEQFRSIMKSDEPGGRKLNFLLQEFNREFNTIGSKTGNTDISHIIVKLKSEIEKIREQVQNVE